MIQLPAIANETYMETWPIALTGFSTNPTRLFALDDNSCVYFIGNDTGQNVFGFHAFVIDGATQAKTWYMAIRNGNQPNFRTIVPLGNGYFFILMDDSSCYVFRVTNAKLNNSAPILIFPQATAMLNDCWFPLNHAYYDSQAKIVSAGFYTGTRVFSTTLAVNISGVTYVSQGFVGNSGGTDPWDRTTGTPNGPLQVQSLSNGGSFAYGAIGGAMWVSRESFSITAGPDLRHCTLQPNGAGVTLRNPGILQTNIAQAGGIFGMIDSNIPGIGGLFNQTAGALRGMHIFAANGLWFYIPATGNRYAAAVTRNYIFMNVEFGGNHWISISASQYGPNGFFAGTTVTKTKWKLSNYARPISVIGKYKA